jgi:hypothetical protein
MTNADAAGLPINSSFCHFFVETGHPLGEVRKRNGTLKIKNKIKVQPMAFSLFRFDSSKRILLPCWHRPLGSQ